jgi:hypothetical protein
MRMEIHLITAGLITAIALASCQPSRAGTVIRQTSCQRGVGCIHTTNFIPSFGHYAGATSYTVPSQRMTEAEMAEAAERERRWEEFCQPRVGAPDANGVQRYIYAHPGCDTGRTQ